MIGIGRVNAHFYPELGNQGHGLMFNHLKHRFKVRGERFDRNLRGTFSHRLKLLYGTKLPVDVVKAGTITMF